MELIGGRYGKYVLDSIGSQFPGGTGHHDRYLCYPLFRAMGTGEHHLFHLFRRGCPDFGLFLAHHPDGIFDEQYGIGLVPMLGIGFHSFIDGFIYANTFTVSIFTGLLAATGMVLHEFPEGIITYLLLSRGGFSEKMSFLLAFLAAALTTPLGMLVSYPYISKIDKPLLGALLAFSAGALVYVGATHLLPQAEAEHKKYSLFALGAGFLVALVIILSKA